ncbi:hypothetical protein, partial [Planomonospora algeriensis]
KVPTPPAIPSLRKSRESASEHLGAPRQSGEHGARGVITGNRNGDRMRSTARVSYREEGITSLTDAQREPLPRAACGEEGDPAALGRLFAPATITARFRQVFTP